MPRVSKSKKGRNNSTKQKVVKSNNPLFPIKWGESYVSLVLGVIVVVVGAILIFSFVRSRALNRIYSTKSTFTVSNENQRAVIKELEQKDANIEKTKTTETAVLNKPSTEGLIKGAKTYTIQKGDDLWKISEKAYGSGYNWVDIAKANNLESNPGLIHVGNKLAIPTVKVKQVVEQPVKVQQSVISITGNQYLIQQGDDLWDISVRAYGDGYKWVEIAKINNITNPDLIFSGRVLKIPR